MSNLIDETDPLDVINKEFPDEQSLINIEDRMTAITDCIRHCDEQISRAIRSQIAIEKDGRQELERATTIILELKQRITDMKSQAKKSEHTVNQITCDIKQLDNAKRNLTSAVTMCNNLNILVESTEKLKHEVGYRQAASILAGIQDVSKQLDGLKLIPQIAHLLDEIDKLCDDIKDRIDMDFKRIFESPFGMTKEDQKLIAEACLVISLFGGETKKNIIDWFLNLQLKDAENQLSSLNGVDKRYSWFKKHLLQFEEKYGFLFPPPWEMSEKMSVLFCQMTHDSLSRMMNSNPNEVRLEPLLYAMSKTTAFEALLAKRFSHPFEGLIFSCFEPHFHVFIESQEAAIQKLIDQFVEEHQKLIKTTSKTEPSRVFNSSNLLFQQYKNSLVQCVQFTNNLLPLHDVFKKHLHNYALKVLQSHLKNSSDIGGKIFSASGAAGLLQSLLRDDGKTKIELNHVCSVILTADYCLETTQQLEKKLKEKIDPSLAPSIDLKVQLELFNELIKTCIELLIHDIESACEPGFTRMVKTNWTAIDTPVGHSPFVEDITCALQTHVPTIRSHLKDGRKYFVQLCNKFITLFTHKYITNLFRCKILSQGGAEQLLLDTDILKKTLVNLPCHNLDIKTAPGSYTKAAMKGFSKAEMVLKVVLVPHDSVQDFVESYNNLLPESNDIEFQRILDVKGIKRVEANTLLEAYRRFKIK